MNCRTAHLLIEAFHDDELAPVDVANLLAHVGSCSPCKARHAAVAEFRETFESCRPEDRCPDELRRRVAVRISPGRRPPAPRPWALTLVAAGSCLVGGYVAGHLRASGASAVTASADLPISLVSERPVTRRIEGEVFCLRCALEKLFPATSVNASSSVDAALHQPMLRTRDGQLLTLLGGAGAGRVRSKECFGHPVAVTARVYPANGFAEVLQADAADSVSGPLSLTSH